MQSRIATIMLRRRGFGVGLFGLLFALPAMRATANETLLLGHPDFRPTPQRPIGWRGDATGRFPGADPVKAWDIEKGVNILWRVPTKSFSNAQPVIVGQRLFVCMEPRFLICMDKMTGQLLWAQDGQNEEPQRDPAALKALVVEVPAEGQPPVVPWSKRKLSYGNHSGNSMPTPVTDGTHIWTKSGGSAACYDLDGKRLWTAATYLEATDHAQNVPSPVLAAGVLVVEGGASQHWNTNSKNVLPREIFPNNPHLKYRHWMVGLDAATGKLLWDLGPLVTGGSGGPPTPAVFTVTRSGEVPFAFVLSGEGALVRASDGKLLNPFIGLRAPHSSPYLIGNMVVYNGVVAELTPKSPDELVVGPPVKWHSAARAMEGGSVYHEGLYYSIMGDQFHVCEAKLDGEAYHYCHMLPKSETAGSSWPALSLGGRYVFALNQRRASVFEVGRVPRLVAINDIELTNSAFVFDGERAYLRTYDSILCIARTGVDGERYEREELERVAADALKESKEPKKE